MPKSDLTPKARAERAFKLFSGSWTQYGYGAWLITGKYDGQLLGDCYLESEAISGSGEVEIGYDVGREFWGRGVATEAARAILRFTFDSSSVERIVGVAMKDNAGSWRVLEHLGFKFEREARLYDLNVAVYANTREQFQPGNAYYQVRIS